VLDIADVLHMDLLGVVGLALKRAALRVLLWIIKLLLSALLRDIGEALVHPASNTPIVLEFTHN